MQTNSFSLPSDRLRHASRVLYALLDAADSAGLMADTKLHNRWHTINALVRAGASYETHVQSFHELLDQLTATAAFPGTWIEKRWFDIQRQVSGPQG